MASNNIRARSFFCVFNNPENHGYSGTPEEICNKLRSQWCTSDHRSGAWVYCVSSKGLKHIHMVLCDSSNIFLDSVLGVYAPGSHFEISKGNKKQIFDYINKVGKFAELGEKVIYSCYAGEILDNDINSKNILELIRSGYSDYDIINSNVSMIDELDNISKARYVVDVHDFLGSARSVNVHYVFGSPGSGKSRGIIEQYGFSNVYRHFDYRRGYFDGYSGQNVLVFEEFRSQIEISLMLNYLDIYPLQLPARYKDKIAKYTEVYIVSNINITEQYKRIQETQPQSFRAFLRRIKDVTYYYDDGSFFTYPITEHSSYRLFTESELLQNRYCYSSEQQQLDLSDLGDDFVVLSSGSAPEAPPF